jgi:hypothetical protein
MEKDTLSGLIAIAVGFAAIIFRNLFAKEFVEAQKTFVWGDKLGEREIKINKILIIVVGIGFIFFGFMEIGLF